MLDVSTLSVCLRQIDLPIRSFNASWWADKSRLQRNSCSTSRWCTGPDFRMVTAAEITVLLCPSQLWRYTSIARLKQGKLKLVNAYSWQDCRWYSMCAGINGAATTSSVLTRESVQIGDFVIYYIYSYSICSVIFIMLYCILWGQSYKRYANF